MDPTKQSSRSIVVCIRPREANGEAMGGQMDALLGHDETKRGQWRCHVRPHGRIARPRRDQERPRERPWEAKSTPPGRV